MGSDGGCGLLRVGAAGKDRAGVKGQRGRRRLALSQLSLPSRRRTWAPGPGHTRCQPAFAQTNDGLSPWSVDRPLILAWEPVSNAESGAHTDPLDRRLGMEARGAMAASAGPASDSAARWETEEFAELNSSWTAPHRVWEEDQPR